MKSRKELCEEYGHLMFFDGFDDCILGVVSRYGLHEPIVCYDKRAILEKLMKQDGSSYEEVVEHFDFNIIGAWVGDKTPCFMEGTFSPCLV